MKLIIKQRKLDHGITETHVDAEGETVIAEGKIERTVSDSHNEKAFRCNARGAA